MTIFHERLVKNLKYYRKLRGLSQNQLALACSLSTNYIGEIEIGRKFPSADTMERMVRALQIHPECLFTEIRESGVIDFHHHAASYASQLSEVLVSYINESLGYYAGQKIADKDNKTTVSDKPGKRGGHDYIS